MSMILDALRKSDRQRARHASERLREGPPVARPAGRNRLLALLAAGTLLAAATAAVLAFRPPGGAASRNTTGPDAEIMENEPVARASVRRLGGELVREAPPERPKPEPVRTVTGRTAPAEAAEYLAAPPLADLPALRIRLPELHVDIHAWAEDPRERFVLINLQRYTEGDRLREGPTLRRILKHGAVLEFEGTLFTLPRQ